MRPPRASLDEKIHRFICSFNCEALHEFHIAVDNIEAADRVLDEIAEACGLLARHKQMGRARPELAADLRSFPVKRFILFYRPDANGVELVRALDGARNVDGIFDLNISDP